MTPSVTQSEIFQTLGGFLSSVTSLPSGSILQGQQNMVPPPVPADYIVMWPLQRATLATNTDDGWIGVVAPTAVTVLTPVDFVAQIDVYGPNSSDNAHVVQSLFRDGYAFDQFTGSGFSIRPLYAGDPRQAPLIDGEQQYEQRWTLDAHMQIGPVVSVPAQFANTAKVSITEAD